MNSQTKIFLLLVAIGLIGYSLYKPEFNVRPKSPISINVIEIAEPSANLKPLAEKVIDILVSVPGHKVDCQKLRDLYIDLRTLISLDAENEVITTSEEIRQANSLAGSMLRLDIKGKYKDLSLATKDVIVAAIGDDLIALNADLRKQAESGFMALAWACNEASKK